MPPHLAALRSQEMPSFPPPSSRLSTARRLYKPAPADESEVRAAFEEIERGETETMTVEEFQRWMMTGEHPCDNSGSGSST